MEGTKEDDEDLSISKQPSPTKRTLTNLLKCPANDSNLPISPALKAKRSVLNHSCSVPVQESNIGCISFYNINNSQYPKDCACEETNRVLTNSPKLYMVSPSNAAIAKSNARSSLSCFVNCSLILMHARYNKAPL
jgi:hypothetical protein